MKIIFFIILIFLSTISFGQFGFVADKDGYANVRKSRDITSQVVDTLNNGHFVYCFDTKANWTNIDYNWKSQELNGYIYSDRIKLVADYEASPLITNLPNSATYGKDSIKIIVTKKKFDKARYRFSYYKDAKSQVEFINGKQYWGTDGEMPKTEYGSIVIQFGNKKTYLPKTALSNLFEPSTYTIQVNYDRENDILYIQSMNSDGAGSYEVIWRIDKGVYKDRYIAYGF